MYGYVNTRWKRNFTVTGAPLLSIHNKTCVYSKITTILYCLSPLDLQQLKRLLYSSLTHTI